MINTLGKITVASAGTPVRITSGQSNPTERFSCHAFLIEADPDNTGFVYVGNSALNKVTRVGTMVVLPVPTENTIPSFSATVAYAQAGVTLHDLFVDADMDGDGVLVSYIEA